MKKVTFSETRLALDHYQIALRQMRAKTSSLDWHCAQEIAADRLKHLQDTFNRETRGQHLKGIRDMSGADIQALLDECDAREGDDHSPTQSTTEFTTIAADYPETCEAIKQYYRSDRSP